MAGASWFETPRKRAALTMKVSKAPFYFLTASSPKDRPASTD